MCSRRLTKSETPKNKMKEPNVLPAVLAPREDMSESLAAVAISECLRLAAQARRLAAASRDPAEKADLLDVARGWLALGGILDGELEREQLKKVAGW
jgi:hypothetical protein